MPTDDKNPVASFLPIVADWLIAVLHPIRTCGALLSQPSDQLRLRATLRLLSAAFTVSLCAQLPLLNQVGIKWDAIGYSLSTFFSLTAIFLVSGLALKVSLRMYGIRAPWEDVSAVYAAYVLCYQPIVEMLTYDTDTRFFNSLALAKGRGMDFHRALWFYLDQALNTPQRLDVAYVVHSVIAWMLLAALCVSMSLIGNTIATHYRVSRVKVIRATAFTMSVLMIPIGILEIYLNAYATYSFLSLSH